MSKEGTTVVIGTYGVAFDVGQIRSINGIVGVSEKELAETTKIYPNPSQGTFYVKSIKPDLSIFYSY